MKEDGRTTSEQLYIPTLLVVGASEALHHRCLHAARPSGLAVRACAPEDAPFELPRRRPIAVVIPNDELELCGHDLVSLARDTRSNLLTVDDEVSVRELEAMIAAAVSGGFSQTERRGAAGRYSIVSGVEDEAPFSRRSLPPASRGTLPPASRASTPPASRGPASLGPASRANLTSTSRGSLPAISKEAIAQAMARETVPPASRDSHAPAASRDSHAPAASRDSHAPVARDTLVPGARSPGVVAARPTPVSGVPVTRPTPVSGVPVTRPTPVSPGVAAARPTAPPVSPGVAAARPTAPPVSGVQRTPSGGFAAIRAVFSSRR
ncbi:MAG: hypothetical protein R3B70_39150 [Polyangiaceae bacterium]